MEEIVLAPRNSLIEQSLSCREGSSLTNGDGFGIGWYGDRPEPGVYREVLPAWNDPNIRHLTRQIRSHLFFAHVRASTGTDTARTNCHPFAHGRWLFMHNGEIGGYLDCRRQLEALIPDGLYPERRGTTDSEIMFLLMVQNGLDDDPLGAIRTSIDQITAVTRAAGVVEPLKLTVCLSDGVRVFACRHASGGHAPSLYWRQGPGHILVTSEPLDDNEYEWNEVAEDTILIVENGHAGSVLDLFDKDMRSFRTA